MDKKELQEYHFIPSQLLSYGFQRQLGNYVLKRPIDSQVYALFTICDCQIKVDVYEISTDEKYFPFYMKHASGPYVNHINIMIHLELEHIINFCTIDRKQQILSYVKEKEGTTIEYPWNEHPSYCTLKVNQKWYGLFMDISSKLLGMDEENLVTVINLKNDPKTIEQFIDNRHFFKAYHMNKKHWMTVLIDSKLDFELLKQLIDQSYQCVCKKG